jgi:hypothetical protein
MRPQVGAVRRDRLACPLLRGRARATWPVAAGVAVLLASVPGAVAQGERGADWPAVKCARYREAWGEALARFGRQGLGADFLERHEAFLASGCRAGREVCPRSQAERDLADALTVAAMNFGTASTFLPFACRG